MASMADTRSLDDWLDYISQQHAQVIDMGLDRVELAEYDFYLSWPNHVLIITFIKSYNHISVMQLR